MRIGILTGGGDAPGLNGVIESATKALLGGGCEVLGIHDGFEGVFEGRISRLDLKDVEGIHNQAGTILGTSNRCGTKGREEEFLAGYKRLKLDGLVAAGGDGTFAGLAAFKDTIALIGVPKTIDNDLAGTDITFGYDTACSVVASAVSSVRATANAHRRIIFVETMGRTAGWIALGGGLACHADAILVPERPFDLSKLVEHIRARRGRGQRGVVAVVAEGVGLAGSGEDGSVGERLARRVEGELGEESRHVALGHLQRSASPTVTDRFLSLAMGVVVAKLALRNKWGRAATYRKGVVVDCPIADFFAPVKPIDPKWVELARAVGIFI